MSSKLLTNYKIKTPYRADKVAVSIAVVLLKNGRVELVGPIDAHENCQKLLDFGKQRLDLYHEAKKARDKNKDLLPAEKTSELIHGV